jgi:hypothetical protein
VAIELLKLSEFFLESHLNEQRIDPFLDVVQLRWRGNSRKQ